MKGRTVRRMPGPRYSPGRPARNVSQGTPAGELHGVCPGFREELGAVQRSSASEAGVSASQSTAPPSAADLTTFSDSKAHFIRVAEMSMPSRSRMKLRSSLEKLVDALAGKLLGGHRRRRLGDGAAVAGEGDLRDASLVVERELHLQLVAAERVVVLELEVGILERAPVPGTLVVLEDVLAVEVVHYRANTRRTSANPSISRSTSACVLWTANEARDVAPTPSRFISGWAQ